MPGILGVINIDCDYFEDEKELVVEKYQGENFFLQRRTINKFLADKVFLDTDQYVLIIEGVVLNKKELCSEYASKSWNDTLEALIVNDEMDFFKHFRGSFSGVIYYKKNKKFIVFTDQLGSKPVFYYKSNEKVIFSSEVKYLINVMDRDGLKYNLDEKGVYSLLSHGYMFDDLTLFDNVKRLRSGCYLEIIDSEVRSVRYHLFNNRPNDQLTEFEIIEKIDYLFNQAVSRQVNKNKEYGYKNYAPLSAGLDSRMTSWVLSQKVDDIVNITYSQSNYFDETIPKKISSELKTHLIFKPLDNGLSLFHLDKMIRTNTSVLYGGPAQVWDTFSLLDLRDVGVIHTGMLGDVVVGTFYKSLAKNESYDIGSGAYSDKLITDFKHKLENYNYEKFNNEEIFNFYNRGFNGANMGSPLVFQEFTESFSPFYDVDFLEFCLTIPMELRWNHKIYDKWVLSKYPAAAKYPHNGRKITKNKGRSYALFGKAFTIDTLLRKGFKYFLFKVLRTDYMNTKNHMNPFDYWYKNNIKLKEYMDDYFESSICLVIDEKLKNNIRFMYSKGGVVEKTQVLTLLSVLKFYFPKC